MTATRVKRVTRVMAEKVVAAIIEQWGVEPKYNGQIELVEDWDGHDFVIFWEHGPSEWPMIVSGGGWVEDMMGGHEYEPAKVPRTVWTEPVNGAVLAIYRT